jgi:hypothetical protein
MVSGTDTILEYTGNLVSNVKLVLLHPNKISKLHFHCEA